MIIGEREIPLRLRTKELIAIQRELGCTAAQLREAVFGIEKDEMTDEIEVGILTDVDKMEKFGTLIRILGNAGLKAAGEAPDLTDEWVLENMKPDPASLLEYSVTVMQEVNEAMSTEGGTETKQKGPVDVIKEKEDEKKEPGK